MRVALLSHVASPHAPTGAERSLALLAGGLASRGHEVAVVAPGPWALTGTVRSAGAEVVTLPTRACWLVQWQPQPPVVQAGRWLRYALPDPGRGRLASWIAAFRPDVVHVNCLPHLGGAAAASRRGMPVVWHVREMLPPSRRRLWWAGRLRRHASDVVAVSEAVAGWLADAGLGDRVTVVHNGIEPPDGLPGRRSARTRLGVSDSGMVVGFVGQLVEHKGPRMVVEAVRRLRAEGRDVSAILAGSGPDAFRRRLTDLATSSGGAVRLIGAVDSPWETLAASDVVAVPTLWPDPLPRSVLEAMAAGRAVVASASGGIPEMVTDGVNGLLVAQGDADEFAAAIGRLVDDPELRTRLGAAGLDRVRDRFGLDRHVDGMEAVLTRAAGQ